MKVLVIGSGGREHSLVWKINQSDRVEKFIVHLVMQELQRWQIVLIFLLRISMHF